MAFFEDLCLPTRGTPRFGDAMTPEQRIFLETASPCLLAMAVGTVPPLRGIWAEAVKGWGKDQLGGMVVLWILCFVPWPVVIQIAADNQHQGGEVKRAIQDLLWANPWLGGRIEVQKWRIVNPATGGECEVLTSDAFGAHGARPDVVLLNEVSHITNEDFAATILDNFSKMPNGFALLETNAGFLGSWAWKWRELYRNNSRWKFIKVTDTPAWQSVADIEEAKRRNPPGRFRRLYCGEWVSPGGDSLPADAIARQIVHEGPMLFLNASEYDLIGIGVDAAVAMHHSSVVVLAGSHEQHKLRIARVVDLPPPCRLDRLRDEIVRQAQRYGVKFISLDPWQLMRVSEELAALGYTVEAQHQTGNVLTRQSAALLEGIRDGVLELYNDPLLVEDLYSARIVEKSYGNRVETMENEHGHGDRLSALLNILPFMLEALGMYFHKPADVRPIRYMDRSGYSPFLMRR